MASLAIVKTQDTIFHSNSHSHIHVVRTYLQYLVLLALVDLAGQAAVGQGVLDNVLVGLGAGLLVQLRPCVTSWRR